MNRAATAANIADCLARLAAEAPTAPALVVGAAAMDFASLDRRVWQAAAWLAARGVGVGGGVVIAIARPVVHLIAVLALARLGARQFSLSPNDAVATVESVIRRADLRLTIADRPGAGVGGLPVLEIGDGWSARGAAGAVEERLRSGDLDLPCFIVASSGTTGEPKVMALTHRQFLGRMLPGGPLGFRAGDRFLCLLDIGVHAQRTLALRALLAGATVHFADIPDGAAVADYCGRHRISHVFALPFVIPVLADTGTAGRAGYGHLRALVMGGSTVTPELFATVIERVTPNAFVVFAANEVGSIAFADAAMRRRHPEAIGRPADGVTCRVVGDDGREAPAGAVGRLAIRAAGVAGGYLGQPDLTAHHFRDGWFYPGDLVSLADDGALCFHGRADDMMIVDGLNVYPLEIERALLAHPAVAEAAAFPLHSKVHQDVLAAAVVLKSNAAVEELLVHCRQHLGTRAPARLMVVDELPRNAMGKVVKRQLAERMVERLRGA